MFRTVPFFLLALALACGSPELDLGEPLNFGTAEQPIVIPPVYGGEGAGAMAPCDNDWEGDECWVPNSKTYWASFSASTCNSWWQARFVEVWNEAIADLAYVNSFVESGKPQWSLNTWTPSTGIATGLVYFMRCDTLPSGTWGGFKPNSSNSDDTSTPLGAIRQHKGGTLKIDRWQIEGQIQWQGANDAARQRYARTALRHEFSHMFGHGHEVGNELMGPNHPDWYANEYWPTAAQYQRQACYNPANSGMFDDC